MIYDLKKYGVLPDDLYLDRETPTPCLRGKIYDKGAILDTPIVYFPHTTFRKFDLDDISEFILDAFKNYGKIRKALNGVRDTLRKIGLTKYPDIIPNLQARVELDCYQTWISRCLEQLEEDLK